LRFFVFPFQFSVRPGGRRGAAVLRRAGDSGNVCARRSTLNGPELLTDLFLEVHAEAPAQIVLDLDDTGDPVHGNQENRFFRGKLPRVLL
jgi:hypothetical protein